MVKIRLHGGFFVARLFPFKCCRRFTSFAICLPYPFGAGNCNTVLPRFLAFSGFITVKSQRWVFPFDNMQPLRCNSKRLICFFFFTTKNFCTTSVVYAICATVGCFLSIWQNCNADAQKFCLQCLPCKREKTQIFTQRRRVRNLCNRWVFFVSIWQNCNADAEKFCLQCLQCKREKPQNPPFMAFICVKSTHLTVNMV